MPDSLLLNGSTDFRDFSAGTVVGSGALTCLFILKKALDATWQNPGGWNALDAHFFLSDLDRLVLSDGTNFNVSTSPFTVAHGWGIVAATKAAGTVAPRYHIFKYGTGVWIHENAGGTITNLAALTTYTIGLSGQAFQPFSGNVLLDAVWDSQLSDGALEAMTLNLSDFVAGAPKELRRYNSAGAITPLVGTSTQTAQSGGTLDTGDAPAGWSDSLGPPQDFYGPVMAKPGGREMSSSRLGPF